MGVPAFFVLKTKQEALMTFLDAINIVLRGVGEGRIQNIDSTHPSVELAKDFLKESQEVLLSSGLWFNIEYSVTIPLNQLGQAILPNETISITSKHPNTGLRLNKDTLYDPRANTYNLSGRGPIVVDYIYNMDFELLPVLAQQAVAYNAASMFIADDDGDDAKYNRAEGRVRRAMLALEVEDMRQKRLNALNAPATARVRVGMGNGRGLRSGDTIGGR